MNWMRLTVAATEANRAHHIAESFDAVFMAAKAPQEAALFSRRLSNGDTVFYFSPAAVAIFSSTLRSFDAEFCDAPSADGATLEIGHDAAREILE